MSQINFVERLPGESKDDYLGRCIPVLIGEGYKQDQAIAICISDFKNFKSMEMTIFGYTTKYFYLCALAQQLFRKLISEENTRDEVVMIRIAAVIVEPVAGSTGVLIPPVGYLEKLRKIFKLRNLKDKLSQKIKQ